MTQQPSIRVLTNRIVANMEKAAAVAEKAAASSLQRKQLQEELNRLRTELQALTTPDPSVSAQERQRQLNRLGGDYTDILLELNSEVLLDVVGNEARAILGPSYEEGVAYSMPVKRFKGESKVHAGRRAAMQAYTLLINKLGKRPHELPFRWKQTS